ncbi:MAG TPA: hypothetical protein VFT98_16180 [Myxococcota bacterium]|nr:hypothetical protein [Myxococcota bacterium]
MAAKPITPFELARKLLALPDDVLHLPLRVKRFGSRREMRVSSVNAWDAYEMGRKVGGRSPVLSVDWEEEVKA